MMRKTRPKYQRVYSTIWGPKRRHWTDDTRLLAFYFLTCPHRATEGLFYLPLGYAAADLGWASARLISAMAPLLEEAFVEYDVDGEVLLIVKALEWQQPDNENQVKGAVRQLANVQESPLLARLYAQAVRFSERFAEGLQQGFPEGFPEPLAEPLPEPIPDPPSPSPPPAPSLSPTPNPIVDSADAEPDVDQLEERPRRKAKLGALKAITVLNLVKEHHGVAWRKPHEYLVAWLQDKAVTVEDAVLLVEFKLYDWRGGEFERFSRNQKTLFAASKREDYLFDAKLWDSKRSKEHPAGPPICGVVRDDFSIEFGANTCVADPNHEGDHDWSAAHPLGETPQRQERSHG